MNKPNFQTRTMQMTDIQQVCAIEKQVQYAPWKESQFIDSLKSYHCTVICDANVASQVLGFCIMQPVLYEANLLLMAIAPQMQGQGLGYLLLDDAMQRLGEKCTQIFLEVRESNIAAIKLYEKSGFHQIDIRKNYYPLPNNQKEHAVIMVKTMDENSFGFDLG
ncbi:ribosomal protein S18-alanine N-acetyltransferase [Acinetobacter sp. c2-A9]|uniref:ribosomal protein S18-alanine N-acetyltransferase n=1 Tax=Acinetobacter sp. c2-A9 TaxID=3342802 RepID=UPI0035BB4719